MAENILKGTIKLDAPGVKETANQVAEGVNKMQSAIKNTIAPIDQATTRNKNYKSSLSDIPKVANDVSQSAQRMANSAASAGGAAEKTKTNFTGLTRVIQDLPFGFVAISNNLEQLLPAAGAVGLAFSGIVSALTFASVGFGAWTRGMSGVLQSTQHLRLSISDLNGIVKDAAKNTGDDIIKLEAYKQKLNDANLPANERLKILKEYNATADKTNQIDATQINNLQLINEKLESQNTLILKRALSTAAMGKIAEVANKLIENELKLQEQLSKRGFEDLDDYIKKQKEANAIRAKQFTQNPNAFKEQQNLDKVRQGLDGIVTPATKAAQAFKEDESAFRGLIATVTKGRSDLQKFLSGISGLLTIEGLTTEAVQDKETKTRFLFDFLPFEPSGKLKPEQKKELLDSIDKFQKEFGTILQGAIFTGTESERIKQALAFDLELKAGNIKFDVKSLSSSFEKLNKDESIIPKDTLQDISSLAIDQFIRAFDNESERIKGAKLFGNIDLNTDQIVGIYKTKFAQIGAKLPKLIDVNNVFGQQIKIPFDQLFTRGDVNTGDAIDAIKKAFNKIKSEIEKQEDFEDIGKQVGSKIGAGFGDAFEQIFSDTLTAAILKGLQGKQLDNFKSAFTAISGIAADGIKGIADAFAGFTDALLRGENGMKAFGNALKGVFKSLAVEIIRDIVLAGILSALTGGVGAASGKGLSFLGALGKLIGGSHATGLKRVPKDGYIAELHKDEMVVPARAADMLRSVMDSNFSIPSVSSVGFSRLNNTSNILAGAERKSIDVNISAVLRASGPDLVATHYKTLRAQKITS